MRSKEEAHDYRYFPDPDLVPIVIDEEWIATARASLPELPDQRKARFMAELGLPDYDAEVLTAAKELADYFEAALAGYDNAKKLSNWIMTELMREFKGSGPEEIAACPVSPANLAALLSMVEKGTISGKIAKTVFSEMMESGKEAEVIVKEKNLSQMSDVGDLVRIVREIIAENPAQVQQFREGKTKVMGFFVGQLMQKTKGQANPQLANELFQKELAT
jgi:aspartyl-tRNA(Asn)/glutamyl-tRNA(Gln) amidotransferase subunit B